MTTTVALPPVCGASGARAFRCRNARKISQATAASQAHESTICMLSPALAFRVPERGIGGCYGCRFAGSGRPGGFLGNQSPRVVVERQGSLGGHRAGPGSNDRSAMAKLPNPPGVAALARLTPAIRTFQLLTSP